MAFVNYASREVNCKIVYYGPGLSGKNDNLQFIYEKTNPDSRGKLISLATETDRTLFFDFLPLELGNVRGFKTRFHLYTVPGQASYDASRKLILKGVDGVVFVADSQRERMDANVESLRNLERNLMAEGHDIRTIPYVLQLNKRDSPTAVPVDEMKASLWLGHEPVLEAIAHSEEGIGVFDTLRAVAKLVLKDLTKVEQAEPARNRFLRKRPPVARPAVLEPFPVSASSRIPPSETMPPVAAPFELKLVPGPRLPASDLVPILSCLLLFLAGSSLFLKPESAEFLAANLGYWILGLAGAFAIRFRNERRILL
jgi:hypothetical protein